MLISKDQLTAIDIKGQPVCVKCLTKQEKHKYLEDYAIVEQSIGVAVDQHMCSRCHKEI
jgi:hypothetical protein